MKISDRDVAIIGMAGRFPGADDVAELWRNLCAGGEGLRKLTDDELRQAGVREDELADPSYVKVCAPLNGVDRFDPAFFKISPLEAELMDPQVRLLLQCAWETLEDAGYAGQGPQRIGVFAGAGGVTTSYFAHLVNISERFEKITASPTQLGNDKDFLSTYVSYKLNLTGPSMTVQTACSTSLVALHQARMSVLNGECEMALAGGVSVRVPHAQGYRYKEGYLFSRTGRIRAFDASADGVVFGSGLGLVLVKRLADAVRDGDHIYAVIKGSAIGNDGKGKLSYAASSARGQIACIRAALDDAGIDASSIGFVETHGTGTSMGDPEEVKALSAAFREDTDRIGYCALGAVKANVGHLEAAAGIVGLIKTALVVRHGLIPPMLHYEAPNPRIRFEATPFRIDAAFGKWPQGNAPRRAGVNSLGVGGTNAFVVLEQYPQPRRTRVKRSGPPVAVPLSARTETSLQAYAARLAAFLEGEGAPLDLVDVAYTLQTGREAMMCRVAFSVTSIAQLCTALRAYIERNEIAVADGEAGVLASKWMAGEAIDWLARYRGYRGARPRRVSLPTYVFAHERCWIDAEPVGIAAAPVSARLHPLLHANTSDLHEHRYSSRFEGDEFFLKDHLLCTPWGGHDGQDGEAARRILPAAAYLEMVHAAFERAGRPPADGRVIALCDIVWVQPVEVGASTQVDIALLDRHDHIAFEVFGADQTVHCQGRARWSDAPRDVMPVVSTLDGDRESWTAERVYAAFASMGLRYGPAHRVIRSLWVDGRAARARLMLPAALRAGAHDFVLHPSLLDGALQTATALLVDLSDPPNGPVVPFALDAVHVMAACPAEVDVHACYAVQRTAQGHGHFAKLDIDLYGLDGTLCVQLRGFAARALDSTPREALLATEVWQPTEASTGTSESGRATGSEGEAASAHLRRVVLCGLPGVDGTAFGDLRDAVSSLPFDSDSGNIAQRYAQLSLECFSILQSMLRGKPASNTLIQFVVPGDEDNRLLAGLSGLLKTATLENPRIAAQLIFVDEDTPAATLAAQLADDANAPHQTLIDRTGGQRLVAQWRLLDAASDGAIPAGDPYRAGGVYLITGALGGLGALFARDIARRATAARIVLTGRAAADDPVCAERGRTLCAALRALGAVAEYRQMKLDDAQQVRSVIAEVLREHGRLNGIFHCAGMTADAFLLKQSAQAFSSVLAPKVAGTWNLHEALGDADLDFFVLFSSLTSALGNLGQGDYAAANGFMDRFAGYRNARVATGQCHGRTLAIRWPLWRDGGMQLDVDGRAQLTRTTGIRPMRTTTGLRMFERSLAGADDQTLVMDGEPVAMRRALGLTTIETPSRASNVSPVAAGVRPFDSLVERTEDYLRAQLAALLKLPTEGIEARAPLEDYGLDSIIAIDLTRMLEQVFGPLSKTLFFEYQNLHDLAGHFVETHAATLAKLFASQGNDDATALDAASVVRAQADAPVTVERVASLRTQGTYPHRTQALPAIRAGGEPIAIVGLSGRYPGARTVDAFWDVLREGRDCIVEVPKDRWDWRDYYSEDRTQSGRHYSKWGGFIEGVDEFDARFFNVSPLEAASLDPQERLFLQHAWMAIEDAGYTRVRLQVPHGPGTGAGAGAPLAGRVGVYAGVMYNEYQLLGAEASLRGRRMGFASNPASIANRVSYCLDLHGPSMVVDTMCSSSLSAIHLACQDLRLGRTAMALAGGVNVTIHPNKYLMLSAGQFISGDGHCQSFGEGGDGYIPGEGVGVVVLKRLADAQHDGDRIYAVIRGSGLSHGGKTNGYTVPNPRAQASAIRDALDDAGVDPRHVSYVEAHGTGTKLGDPIEIAALTSVFRAHTADTGFCLIGSAKSNIGHCEAAAGIAGLTKVLLQMRHRKIVPSLHSAALNPHIDFAQSPFLVNQRLREWSVPVADGRVQPRIAGISSFGAGGSNAHLIVEEYVEPLAQAAHDTLTLVPLSARTAEQLRQKAHDLLTMLRAPGSSATLASIAYTLQAGREAMPERVGWLVDSLDSLGERLRVFVDGDGDGGGRAPGTGIYRGYVRGSANGGVSLEAPAAHDVPTLRPGMDASELARVLEQWVAGVEPDWRALYREVPRIVSLPAYPFARQRHWVDVGASVDVDPPAPQGAAQDAGPEADPLGQPKQAPVAIVPRRVPIAAALRVNAPAATYTRTDGLAPASLVSFGDADAVTPGRQGKPRVALADIGSPAGHGNANAVHDTPPAPDDAAVELFDHGDGVYAIRVHTPELTANTIEGLLNALRTAEAAPDIKVLLLGGGDGLPRGERAAHAEAIAQGLYRAIAAFPCPTIAVMGGDARGPGFLAGALCDIMVCSETARYGFTMPDAGLFPSGVRALFDARFGYPCATGLLYLEPLVTGLRLRQMGWRGPLLQADSVEAHARALAADLARKPQRALHLLKRELARTLVDAVGKLQAERDVSLADVASVEPAAPVNSSVWAFPDATSFTQLAVQATAPGLLLITLRADDGAFDSCTLAAELGELRNRLTEHAPSCCVVLISEHENFLPLDAMRDDAQTALRMYETLRGFVSPLITVLDRGAAGLAWLTALGADVCVYAEQGRYSTDGLLDDARLADHTATVFARHFDDCAAKRLVSGGVHTGRELQSFGALQVVDGEQALVHATRLASALAAWPRDALAAFKHVEPTADEAGLEVSVQLPDAVPLASPGPITLESEVVTAFAHADGVLEIRMADRDTKNLFSDALSRGLTQMFEHVAASGAYKVVVLTGYDQYFSSGATRETLLAIQGGGTRFTDNPLFRLPLDCDLPVIAAMQGHGIGAGWALGMFSDLALFGEASRYRSPYMDYGFTPGAGATLIFPHAIGRELALESLLSAREYSGMDLAARGLSHTVLARDAVREAALTLAGKLARTSRAVLVALKRRWAFDLRRRLDATLERELAMHAQTLIGQAGTLARIEHGFGAVATAPIAPTMRSAPESTTAVPVAPRAVIANAAHVDAHAIARRLRAMLAQELRMDEADVADDVQFVELGLDSITGVTWIRKINETYGTAIEAVKVYSYPTLAALARFVADEAARAQAAAGVGAGAMATPPADAPHRAATLDAPVTLATDDMRVAHVDHVARHDTPAIAVIGMAGRFAHADTLDEFWRNLADGRDCIDEVPRSRWDLARYYQGGEASPGKTYSKWLGMLDGHDCFDAAFFHISPREARAMDPQQRVFLEACWHGIEHAGYDPKTLAGSRCGVFVGCAAGDYHQLSERERLSGPGFTGASPAILAARISYALDLQGPSLAVDTACSSSLVAIASACDSLVAGASDLALAGGVNVLCGPAMHIMTSQMGMLSPQGRCYTFDDRADGIALGEGAGVVVLKRLADAERDGDCIYGVVQGWGVNQDGKTNGITAPNADSQARLQRHVYERFGIDPAGIGLIEAHGTGTALGDPIEVAALKTSFGHFTRRTNFCALGSVKSNIGHCLSAAGVSGFLKALLAIGHAQLPPAAQFRRLNRHIALQDSPFFVNETLRAWPREGDAPRRAAVNSFGFSGTNAHVVVAEYQGRPDAAACGEDALVPLSARTPDRLMRKASDLLAFLDEPAAQAHDMARIAYTLQVGREAMTERVAFVVQSLDDLRAKLRAFVEQAHAHVTPLDGIHRADALANRETWRTLGDDADFRAMIGKWIAQRELTKLADLWVKGLDVDWARFHADGAPRRIGLPLYPFADERHWLVADETEDAVFPALVSAEVAATASTVTTVASSSMVASSAASTNATTPAIAAGPVSTPAVSLAQLREQLRVSLAQALLIEPGDIGNDQPFIALGLDSILGVEWVKAINRQHHVQLAATRVYDYPTLDALTEFIAGQLPASTMREGRDDARDHARPVTRPRTAFSFAPKHVSPYRELYFYSPDCDGDFETDGECAVRFRLDPDHNVCLREHVVFGEHLLPTDAYIELVYSAFRTYFDAPSVRFERVGFVQPLLGVRGSECHVKIVFRRSGDALQFFVRSTPVPDSGAERLHMQGFIAVVASESPTPEHAHADGRAYEFDVQHTLARDGIATNTGTCYAPLDSLAFGASHASGEIRPAAISSGFLIGPFALYGGLCTVINHCAWLSSARYGASSDQFLPHRIGAIAAHRVLDGRSYRCHARLRKLERDAAEFDFDIVDETGALVLSVEGISLRRVAESTLRGQTALPLDAAAGPLAPGCDGESNGDGESDRSNDSEKVAVIGLACRYPRSPDADAFWRNLAQGIDCVSEIPAERWPQDREWFHADRRHPGTSYSKWAGLLDRIDTFDPLFFGISPAEAELIDPQQRIFLEECWNAIESAGYAPSGLSGLACGIYVGCSTGDYARVLSCEGQDTAGAAFMGASSAVLAARISYLLNLKGAAVAVDTACSSSLVALHLACESIRNGENDMALAGGINLLATPIGHILTSQVGMPSPDGRCAPFDANANGIVFSEGCGVLVLKPLSRALADNDEILGVIEASGTNQDGKTNGITAPSSTAQAQLLRQTYRRFGIDPRRIGYVEAHGTGTPLGDPIEVAALDAAFAEQGVAVRQCALGSVKSNIGHTGFAAGVAGVVKALLCLRHRKLVPSIHYRAPNPHIDLAQSPFFVNTEYRDWDCDGARVAAVSAFGFSGTNAHVVIAEHVRADDEPAHVRAAVPSRHAVPLSARSESQLREQAARLLAYLNDAEQPVDPGRVAYTLQVGRDAMAHRVGFIAASAEQLAGQLRAYLDGAPREPDIYRGPVMPDASAFDLFADDDLRRLLGEWFAQRNLPKLMSVWVRGVDVDWRGLYADAHPRPLALPTYPFARERYWASASSAARPQRSAPILAPAFARAGTALHPLLQQNTSDLDGQRYTSRFDGNERMLAEHRVNGEAVLPAAAYLEMVRAALGDALPGGLDGLSVYLRDVVWLQPLVVAAEQHVTVALYDEDDIVDDDGVGNGRIGFEIQTIAQDGSAIVHCHGHCFAQSTPEAPPLDLMRLRQRMTGERLDAAVLYPRFAELGLDYGSAYQGIVALHQGDGEALVELCLPVSADGELSGCVLHPSIVDSALQGTIALAMAGCERLVLPFALEALDVVSPCVPRMTAWVRYTDGRAPLAGTSLVKLDIDLCDREGSLCARLRGFSSRPMDSGSARAAPDGADIESLLERVLNHEISSDEAAELTRSML